MNPVNPALKIQRPFISRTKHWTYLVNPPGVELPSVTTIIGATVPKELGWYGMRIGVSGMLSATADQIAACLQQESPLDAGISLLKQKKVTTWHYMNNAKEIGNEVHGGIEKFIKTGKLEPEFSPLAQVRINAFEKFLTENQFKFLVTEVMTASLLYGYAGTYDARMILEAGKYAGSLVLGDWKNTGKIYEDQYFPQLEAYEGAEIELGEQPTDLRIVVRLCDDGNYEIGVSTDSLNDFLILKDHWDSIQARKVRIKSGNQK